MVGWSRRNAESSRRRQAWWNSLTPGEQEEERRKQFESDRIVLPILYILMSLSIGALVGMAVAHCFA